MGWDGLQDDAVKALRAVHSRFYLSETPIGVVLVGPGLVGATFLDQLKDQLSVLMDDFNIDLQLMGIASSKEMHCDPRGINFHSWKEVREQRASTQQEQPIDYPIIPRRACISHASLSLPRAESRTSRARV